MSHPGAISCRCSLKISRRRRRIRLRRTALPSAFLMLQPNRLLSRPLGRRNNVNSRLLRRRPSRYTASYSARRSRRKARGKSSRAAPSDAREAVAPFFAASCKNFPSTLRFHALAKAVLFMSAPHMRLKSAFRQRSSPSQCIAARALLRIAGLVETSSLDDLRATVKEPRRRAGGSVTNVRRSRSLSILAIGQHGEEEKTKESEAHEERGCKSARLSHRQRIH
jgi:hypothetical protein